MLELVSDSLADAKCESPANIKKTRLISVI